jgi:hypothetical protein
MAAAVVCFLARGQARAREAWEPAAPGPSLSKSVSFPMRLACCRGDRLRCDDAVNAILPSGFRQMVATSSLAPPKQNRRHRAQHPNVATLTPQYEAALRSSQQSGGIGHSRTWNTPRRPAKSASTASSRVISRRSAKAGRGATIGELHHVLWPFFIVGHIKEALLPRPRISCAAVSAGTSVHIRTARACWP